MRSWFKESAFTLWLIVAVFLALVFPVPASGGGCLHSEITTKLGVWLIFFLLGLSLPTRELVSSYRPVRLHVFVLVWNYLGFPLVTGLLLYSLPEIVSAEFKLGFWLLAIMPTTIASAVTFTTVSGGHTSNAIVATVLSNIVSVFIVPVVAVAYFALESGASIPLLPVLSNIASLIVLPIVMGQLLRGWLPRSAAIADRQAKRVSRVIILFIVHVAFANSLRSGELKAVSWSSLAAVLSGVLVLLILVSFLVWWTARYLRLSAAQRIAAFYCASQKSLATGLPLATALLAVAPDGVAAGVVLIPLIVFHPMQLVLAGVLSKRFGPSA